MRNFARTHIIKRKKEIENNEHVPNDLLSVIINSAGNYKNHR